LDLRHLDVVIVDRGDPAGLPVLVEGGKDVIEATRFHAAIVSPGVKVPSRKGRIVDLAVSMSG
jgi:hypothetical protein